jgi:SLT domain-containing protein
MAGQSITFDFLSRGAASLSRDFRSIGDDSALSSRGVKVLQEIIEKLGDKEKRTSAESAILARALRQTGDASATAAAKMVVADAAVRRLGDAMADSSKKGDSLGKTLSGLKMNPGLAGPALALAPAIATLGGVAAGAGVALAGAFVAGGAALAAFGAIAKPVLASAKTAATAVETAQNAHALAVQKVTAQYQIAMSTAKTQAQRNAAYAAEQKGFQQAALGQQLAVNKAYADLSPAQIALSKQIGAMADAWQKVKAAQTPVVAGALLPWMQAVTSLTRQLGPIIAAVSGVLGSLGSQFGAIISSAAFTKFRDFIAQTGSRAVGAAGNALLGLFQAFIIILPKFTPLIQSAITWIGNLGPAIEKWASSKKTADQITAFMAWFKTNGAVVGGLLTNLGLALKAMAPGLTAGGAAQLKVMSDFFGLIAKLPSNLAKPLFEVAGALLILNKLGVVSVGIKLLGMDAAAAVAGGGAAGLWGKILPGVRLLGGALVAVVVVDMILKNTRGPGDKPGQNLFDNPFGADPKSKDTAKQGLSTWAGLGNQITQIWDTMWQNTITRTAKGFHDLAGWFDKGRHDIATKLDDIRAGAVIAWNGLWANTVTRTANGVRDVGTWWRTLQSGAVLAYNTVKTDIANAWSAVWANTRTVVGGGVAAVAGFWRTLQSGVVSAYSQVKTSIANTWSTIWTNTKNTVTTGIGDVVRFFTGLPGKITAALGAAGKILYSWGSGIITGLLAGITSVWQSVVNFFLSVPKAILHALGIKSPPQWAIDAGKHIMHGIGIGVDFAKGVVSKATAAAIQAAAVGGVAGTGVQRWRPVVRQALGLAGANVAQLTDPVLYQMQTESGGNPTIVNKTDSNWLAGHPSVGLMQVIQGTFDAYAGRFRNTGPFEYGVSVNPLANVYAAIKYAQANYGPGLRNAYGGIGTGHGYAYGTASALPGWAWVGERGPELVKFRGGEQVAPVYAGGGGGEDIKALLERIHWAIRGLTDVAAAIPARTGQHVAAGVNSAGADAAFRRRYPQGGGW